MLQTRLLNVSNEDMFPLVMHIEVYCKRKALIDAILIEKSLVDDNTFSTMVVERRNN